MLLVVKTQKSTINRRGKVKGWGWGWGVGGGGGGGVECSKQKFIVLLNHQNHISVLKSMGFDDFRSKLNFASVHIVSRRNQPPKHPHRPTDNVEIR